MLSWQELELFWRQLERRGTGKKQVLRVRRRAVRTIRSVVMTRGRPHAKRPIRKIYTKRDHKPPIAGKRMRAHARIRLCIKAPLKVGQILFFWCPSSFSKWFSSEKMMTCYSLWFSAAVNVCLFWKLRLEKPVCQKLRVAKNVNKVRSANIGLSKLLSNYCLSYKIWPIFVM